MSIYAAGPNVYYGIDGDLLANRRCKEKNNIISNGGIWF